MALGPLSGVANVCNGFENRGIRAESSESPRSAIRPSAPRKAVFAFRYDGPGGLRDVETRRSESLDFGARNLDASVYDDCLQQTPGNQLVERRAAVDGHSLSD